MVFGRSGLLAAGGKCGGGNRPAAWPFGPGSGGLTGWGGSAATAACKNVPLYLVSHSVLAKLMDRWFLQYDTVVLPPF